MKTAIIGAGIIGLYLARKLAQRKEDVTVFEKKGGVGKEACSGLFSDRIFEFIPESKKLIQNTINYVLIHFPKKTLKVYFKQRFFLMNRKDLDNLAAVSAQEAGAKIIFNTAKNILEAPGFERVICCDGASSEARKSLKLKEPQFFLGFQGTQIRQDFSDFVETWPTKNGFIWKIPRGKETEWGIMEKPEIAKKLFEEFIFENNLNLQEIKGALIPQGLILAKNKKITLVGDAAGLCKPWSGGGVIWGLTAADILLKNFPDFVKYENRLKKSFSFYINFSKAVKKLVYFLGFNFPWVYGTYEMDGDFV